MLFSTLNPERYVDPFPLSFTGHWSTLENLETALIKQRLYYIYKWYFQIVKIKILKLKLEICVILAFNIDKYHSSLLHKKRKYT